MQNQTLGGGRLSRVADRSTLDSICKFSQASKLFSRQLRLFLKG